jgi:hypothetical protein
MYIDCYVYAYTLSSYCNNKSSSCGIELQAGEWKSLIRLQIAKEKTQLVSNKQECDYVTVGRDITTRLLDMCKNHG